MSQSRWPKTVQNAPTCLQPGRAFGKLKFPTSSVPKCNSKTCRELGRQVGAWIYGQTVKRGFMIQTDPNPDPGIRIQYPHHGKSASFGSVAETISGKVRKFQPDSSWRLAIPEDKFQVGFRTPATPPPPLPARNKEYGLHRLDRVQRLVSGQEVWGKRVLATAFDARDIYRPDKKTSPRDAL